MIERMAGYIVNQIIKEQLINEEQKEYYNYAFIVIVEKIITIGTICVIGFLMDILIQTLFFLFFFLALRKRAGGYHANSFMECYFGTTLLYGIVSGISFIGVNYSEIIYFFLVISICIIEIIGTVNHPNMHMNAVELTNSKKATRIIAVLEGSIIFFLAYIGVDKVTINYMAMAVILCATLLCIAKILKQEVKYEKD